MSETNQTRLRFDADDLPERDRFPAFCEGFVRRYVALDIVNRGADIFRGSLEIQRAGSVHIAAVAGSPISLSRTQALMRDGNDGVAIIFCRSGILHASQSGNEHRLQRGEAVVCDNARLGCLSAQADIDVWAVEIPRSRLSSLVAGADDLGGCKLTNNPDAVRLLFSYLKEFSVAATGLNQPASRLFGDHIIDLVALALATPRMLSEARRLPGVREAKLLAVLEAIKCGFSDADFSASCVATKLGITPRYVHHLLEGSGKTFSQYVLQLRLNRAAQLLSDPSRDCQKIGDIALEVGFADISHFNRSFRKHFGQTPRAIRIEANQKRWCD